MRDATEQRVLEAVNRDRVTELCRDLVRIPTVNPYSGDRNPSGELAGQEHMEAVFKDMGADTERLECIRGAFEEAGVLAPGDRVSGDRPNIIATFKLGNGEGPTLLLDAHMDTVAVDTYAGDPYSAELRDGCIHGRGSSDDKGGLSVMIEAVRAVLDSGAPCSGRLVCCSVVDEESNGSGWGTLSCLQHLPRPDAAIVVDGSTDGPYKACTGVITAEIIVKGKSGHAAYGNSVNAIEKAVAICPAFDRFRAERGDTPGEFNLGTFHSGNHPANVPCDATLGMNIKTSLDDMRAAEAATGKWSGGLVRELLEKHVRSVAETDPFLRDNPPLVRWIKDLPSAETEEAGEPFPQLVAQAFQDVRGEPTVFGTLGGWGDMSHCIRAGIPTIGCGPATHGVAHSAAERVATEDLYRTSQALALIISRFLGEGR